MYLYRVILVLWVLVNYESSKMLISFNYHFNSAVKMIDVGIQSFWVKRLNFQNPQNFVVLKDTTLLKKLTVVAQFVVNLLIKIPRKVVKS